MYSAEIVSIGQELLNGQTINSNAAFISKKLSEAGFEVIRHTSISDNKELIIETLAESLACSSVVITTGGLGPTLDDLTKEAVAELTESELELDPVLAEALEKRFGPIDSIENQATVPVKARLLTNLSGTAPGLIFIHQNAYLIVLPGVPLEMELMMENEVLPYLQTAFPPPPSKETARLHFFNLFESTVDPVLRKIQSAFPELKIGIYPNNSLLTVCLEGDIRAVEFGKQAILDDFGELQYLSSDGTIEKAIQELFIANQWTLACAESCTGGAIAMRLTRAAGASQYFLGSMVAYSNHLKTKMLQVDAALIEDKGAVSKETCLSMASHMREMAGSTFSLATSGIAGPSGGSLEKPVGTVYISLNKGSSSHNLEIHAKGERASIIERTVHSALSELYRFAKTFTSAP